MVRHVGPTRAWVRIGYRPDEVGIEITDDGPGGPAPPPARAGSGHGMIGMRERATMLRGTLVAQPPATGFLVTARLPIDTALPPA